MDTAPEVEDHQKFPVCLVGTKVAYHGKVWKVESWIIPDGSVLRLATRNEFCDCVPAHFVNPSKDEYTTCPKCNGPSAWWEGGDSNVCAWCEPDESLNTNE